MNFIIYHAALRAFLENTDDDLAEFERSGYIRWTSDLAAIPEKFGVTNVFAEIGSSFATSAVTNPRFCAAFMGTLVKRMGHDHILWGTNSVWYGSPQWQIEAMRRLEIPDDMQKKSGLPRWDPPTVTVKNAILGFNGARHYHLDLRAAMNDMPLDGIAKQKAAYLENGGGPQQCRLRLHHEDRLTEARGRDHRVVSARWSRPGAPRLGRQRGIDCRLYTARRQETQRTPGPALTAAACTVILSGGVSPNRRKFRQDKFSPATIASRSITCPLSRKV